MLYHVSRNGQVYGPYTLEDLERYVASGNVLPTDMARAEGTSEWIPVSQIAGQRAAVPPFAAVPPPEAYGAAASAYPAGVPAYPDPPGLHWALVLVFGLLTCGLFIVVWDIVQAVWMRRVNPRSNALFLYLAGDAVNIFGSVFRYNMAMSGGMHATLGLGVPVGLIALVLIELARFDMRRTLEEHYNGPEPVGLMLGPVMTFFFGSLYFQYHLTRINEMKRMARYRTGLL
jgi:hypothetical protein